MRWVPAGTSAEITVRCCQTATAPRPAAKRRYTARSRRSAQPSPPARHGSARSSPASTRWPPGGGSGEILQAEEAAELERGYRHLTVVHGYLERHEDWELLERLLTAVDQACAGHHWHREGRKDRFTLTVGPPDADRVVTRLAELARALAEKAAVGGWRWQVALLKEPAGAAVTAAATGPTAPAQSRPGARPPRRGGLPVLTGWACLVAPVWATPGRVKGARCARVLRMACGPP